MRLFGFLLAKILKPNRRNQQFYVVVGGHFLLSKSIFLLLALAICINCLFRFVLIIRRVLSTTLHFFHCLFSHFILFESEHRSKFFVAKRQLYDTEPVCMLLTFIRTFNSNFRHFSTSCRGYSVRLTCVVLIINPKLAIILAAHRLEFFSHFSLASFFLVS